MKRPDPDAPVVQWAVYARSLEKENEELRGKSIEVDYPEHGMIVLTNSRGDTYTSKSEELIDFFYRKVEALKRNEKS